MKYDVKSSVAEEFINDQEILDTIEYAKKNKSNKELIFGLIERAKDCKGLSHREAAVLLECDIPEANEKIKELAISIKEKLYGRRIVMFAPLYLSNYCVNGCTYCPYHYCNKHITKILNMRFACCIGQNSCSFCQNCCHNCIFCCCY